MASADQGAPRAARTAALGIDVGTAVTKLAVPTGPNMPGAVRVVPTAIPGWSPISAPAEWSVRRGSAAAMRDFLTGLFRDTGLLLGTVLFHGPDAVAAIDPPTTALVAAVPEAWLGADSAGQAAAMTMHRILTDELGFAEVRLVSNLLCVAAAFAGDTDGTAPPHVQLVCDVGAATIAAAVCAIEGRTVRLLEVESGSAAVGPADTFDEIMLDALGYAGPPAQRGRLRRALHDERQLRAQRAVLVLERAARQPRYGATPVYFPSGSLGGGQLPADVLLRGLAPIAHEVRQVVERLASHTAEMIGSEVIMTGGFAGLPPIRDAVLDALAAQRDRVPCLLGASAAARGALLIADGAVRAEINYPHTLGLAVHRIRHGLLESATVPVIEAGCPIRVGTAGTLPLTVRVERDQRDPVPVRVRLHGQGPWRIATPTSAMAAPPGDYRVGVSRGRSSLGSLVLHPIGGGAPLVYPLAAELGPTDQVGDSTGD